MDRRVVITGAGVISPLGDSPRQVHTALSAGRSGLGRVTLFDTEGLCCQQGCEIAGFTPKQYLGERNVRPLDRTAQLVAVAAQLALADSGWSTELRSRIDLGFVLGTMFCSVHTISEFDRRALTLGPEYASPMDFANTVINAAAGQVAIWHNLRGINSTVAAGASAGLRAIAYAADLIRGGEADALLAGGGEELCFETFYSFDRAGMLCGSRSSDEGERPVPFDARRNGFALGEGAALLMLEEAGSAATRGARILAEIKGCGTAYENRKRGTSACGAGIARAIRLALEEGRMRPDEIDCLSASANGSIGDDAREARGVAAALGECARTLPVVAIKSMLGEALGASGAMQVIDMMETLRDGVLPGVRGLDQIEEGMGLTMMSSEARQMSVRAALLTSATPEGNSCALILNSFA